MSDPLLWDPPLPPRTIGASSGPLSLALHVVLGDSAGGLLRSAGARPLLVAPDQLTVGPGHAVPKRHREARGRFWRSIYTAARFDEGGVDHLSDPDLARTLRLDRTRPVMLWTTGEWRGLLFLAWAVDAATRARVRPDQIWVAGDLASAWPLAYLNPENITSLATSARRLPVAVRSACERLWHAFVAQEPAELALLARRPPAALPTLRQGLSIHAALFPQLSSRRLHLSAVDRAVLGSLSSNEWRSFPDMVQVRRRHEWPFSAVFAMIAHFGDMFVQARLAAWSAGTDPAAEESQLKLGTYRSKYLLTARGRRLLARGFDDTDAVPHLQVGGYDSRRRSLWVCERKADSWQLRPA